MDNTRIKNNAALKRKREIMNIKTVDFNHSDKVTIDEYVLDTDERDGKIVLVLKKPRDEHGNGDDDDTGDDGGRGGKGSGGKGHNGGKKPTVKTLQNTTVEFSDNKRMNAIVYDRYGVELIYGRCQSGKTEMTLRMMVQEMAALRCSGVYICREFKVEAAQQYWSFYNRVKQMEQGLGVTIQVKLCFENMTKKERREKEYNVALYSEVAQDMIAAGEGTIGDELTLFVMMGNVSAFDKIVRSFDDGASIKYCLGIDEADTFVRGDYDNYGAGDASLSKAQFKFKLTRMIEAAAVTFLVSATQLDTSEFIPSHSVPNANITQFGFDDFGVKDGVSTAYRSMHKVKWHDLPVRLDDESISPLKIAIRCVEESIENKLYLPYKEKNSSFLMMGWHSEINAENESYARQLSQHPFTIDATTVFLHTFTTDQQGFRAFYKGKEVGKKDCVKSLLDMIKSREWRNHSVITYMFGSRRVSRAANITDSDYRQYIGGTVYTQNDSDRALMVQRASRMCGLSPVAELNEQHFWSTKRAYGKILDTIDANSQFMEALQVGSDEDREYAETENSLVLGTRRVPQGHICKKRAINQAPQSPTVLSPHQKQEPVTPPPPPPEVPSELTATDLTIMIGNFRKWASGTDKITSFMKHLKPEQIYTKSDLADLLKESGFPTLSSINLTRYRNEGGYGKIMRKVGEGYQLHPELVPHYKKFFN